MVLAVFLTCCVKCLKAEPWSGTSEHICSLCGNRHKDSATDIGMGMMATCGCMRTCYAVQLIKTAGLCCFPSCRAMLCPKFQAYVKCAWCTAGVSRG